MLWPGLLLLSMVGALLVTFVFPQTGAQPWVVGWFLLVCPGMAFVRLLELDNTITELTVALALSLTLDALVAWLLVLGGQWQPRWGLVILMGLTAVGIVLQVRQGRQRGDDLPRSHIAGSDSAF